jgi:DNA-binding XRE family transcriptional regulator
MRRRLVQYREDALLSREVLAQKIGVNVRTVTRWETGERRPQMTQKAALAKVLSRSVAEINLALNDDHAGPIGHVMPSTLTMLASLEQAATELRTWQPIVVPGLLQIERYATAVESAGPDRPTADEVARWVGQRMERQHVLDRLRLFALLDISVLHRTTGAPGVLQAQLAHLHTMNEQPNVDIRIMLFDERVHPAGRGSFTLLTSDGPEPFMACSEDLAGVHYHEAPSVVEAYTALWAYMWEASHALAEVDVQRNQG